MRRLVIAAAWVGWAAALAVPATAQQTQQVSVQSGSAHTSHASHYEPMKLPQHARAFYQSVRGIDRLSVRRTASGNLLRFSYRVTDPAAAKLLGDKSTTPYLYGEAKHVLLEVPVMDNIGQLRQTGDLEVGQEYWMVFSNKGDVVKAGDRVNVLIGSFHIDGLVVQ
ncbi:hypothetical protein ACFQ3P_00655 [Paraburkholderia sabiae]|jgi:hypothetical protein|uniref:Transmembrane protein n=1 Tax=Paraburkholderia sabiae TaxID=273251 RepID=A0ABU9Q8P9_9BURK|nr:hypothetical protein [Paraburkholderia sabiae]WJZ78396.1 hypothetical protein QEN71_30865 [Paraburkholderia sabiae]CAD6508085.1 hypothetical protein LMG24235_00130 [Paraburkholderia sabiae]